VTVQTWKTRAAWRTRRSSYRHQLPTSSWLETSSWTTLQGRSLPRAKSTRSWARMTAERQTQIVVDLPLQIWQRDVAVRVLFPSSAWHVWLLCVFGYGRLARCGKTDRESEPSALCCRWGIRPATYHAVYTLAGLGKDQLLDPFCATPTGKASGMITLVSRHDRLFSDRFLADKALITARRAHWTAVGQEEEVCIGSDAIGALCTAETFGVPKCVTVDGRHMDGSANC
jgi:hypothetical protein